MIRITLFSLDDDTFPNYEYYDRLWNELIRLQHKLSRGQNGGRRRRAGRSPSPEHWRHPLLPQPHYSLHVRPSEMAPPASSVAPPANSKRLSAAAFFDPPSPPTTTTARSDTATQPTATAGTSRCLTSASAAPTLHELPKQLSNNVAHLGAGNIHPLLAIRLRRIATLGMTNDALTELIKTRPLPTNCLSIGPPALNEHCAALINDTVRKKDNDLAMGQERRAAAITRLAEALTILMSQENRDMWLIKLIMDATKLICDDQHKDSKKRRENILKNVDRDVGYSLKNTNIDRYLFDEDRK